MPTGRVYSVEFENVAVTAAQELFYVAPADDKPVELLGVFVDNHTDFGDAQEEGLRFKVIRGHTTASSGGTAPTPTPMNATAQAAGFTARVNDTTLATAGTAVDIHSGGFNVRVGLAFWWTPETAPDCSQAQGSIVVRLVAAPADSITLSGTLYVRELG